jgi:antitoxin (DNA-binding transcriptional repressor) of toxin-antitoxin stability system
MSDAAHDAAYELPSDETALAEAVREAEGGEVVYLTRHGERVAALVPPEVARVGAAVIEALEDEEDIRCAREALEDPAPSIPWEQVKAEADL